MEEFNYYTQGVKFGLGWCSYVAAFEARSGDLTREEASFFDKRNMILNFPRRGLNDFLRLC